MIPTKKMSETILEFGSPVLERLPKNATKEDFQKTMRLIVSAWNAVVLDEWNKSSTFEEGFLQAIPRAPRRFKNIPKKLLERKKSKYSSDLRAVGKYEVIEKNGGLVFRAEFRVNDTKDVNGIKETASFKRNRKSSVVQRMRNFLQK